MIRVSNLSKTYLIWQTPFSRLFVPLAVRMLRKFFPHYVAGLMQKYCQPIQALTNVDFSVESGDSLGIIGLNGSGKSTLLQIIAGTLQPSQGSVKVVGRVAALLELGSGFDPEFTGRENVFLNASILGLSQEEIASRYDAIVAFADIGDFIDRPVKTYSSGMMVRLAFAVQVHVDPDVLIVDEALAVGDARFQAKALAKIDTILRRGTTLLFVGHDLSAVRAFCNRAILLEKGRVKLAGDPDTVLNEYIYSMQKEKVAAAGIAAEVRKTSAGHASDFFFIKSTVILDHGAHATLKYKDKVAIKVDYELSGQLSDPYIIFEIVDAKSLQLTGKRIKVDNQLGAKSLSISFESIFQKGIYRIQLRLVNAPTLDQTVNLSIYNDFLSFEMLEDVRSQFVGLFPLPMEFNWKDIQ
jgi:lipopolysaccharide transport system ATP-binding protein